MAPDTIGELPGPGLTCLPVRLSCAGAEPAMGRASTAVDHVCCGEFANGIRCCAQAIMISMYAYGKCELRPNLANPTDQFPFRMVEKPIDLISQLQ